MKKLNILISVVAMSFVMSGCGGGSSDNSSTTPPEVTPAPPIVEDKLLNETIPGLWHTFVYNQDGVIGSAFLNYELLEDGTAIQSAPYVDKEEYVTTWEYENGKLVIQLSDGELAYEPIEYEDEVNKIIRMKLTSGDGDFMYIAWDKIGL